eukprot:jgi/Mesen1/8304/ME000455S07464
MTSRSLMISDCCLVSHSALSNFKLGEKLLYKLSLSHDVTGGLLRGSSLRSSTNWTPKRSNCSSQGPLGGLGRRGCSRLRASRPSLLCVRLVKGGVGDVPSSPHTSFIPSLSKGGNSAHLKFYRTLRERHEEKESASKCRSYKSGVESSPKGGGRAEFYSNVIKGKGSPTGERERLDWRQRGRGSNGRGMAPPTDGAYADEADADEDIGDGVDAWDSINYLTQDDLDDLDEWANSDADEDNDNNDARVVPPGSPPHPRYQEGEETEGGTGAGAADGRQVAMIDRVFELQQKVQAGDGQTVTSRDIAALYDFPIDKFQRLAVEAVLKGSSVVVCAPTSSGKTLIAEAAAAAMMARGRRLIYTTPLKALSNQKLREFRAIFGEGNVGLLTGDAAVNRDAPIVVMTTEILRNMLYSSVGSVEEGSRLEGVDAIVLDEVHYLSDISRGTVWEETVIYCPPAVQLVCLSATVANPEELADWIAQVHGPTELVTSNRRPVPLMWHFSTRHSLDPLLNERGSDISRVLKQRQLAGYNRYEQQQARRSQVPRVADTLEQLRARDMLPAIWFVFSRRGCDTAVSFVSSSSSAPSSPSSPSSHGGTGEAASRWPQA